MFGWLWLLLLVAAIVCLVALAAKLWAAGTVISAGVAVFGVLVCLVLIYAVYDSYWGLKASGGVNK